MLDRTDSNNRRTSPADRDEYGRHLETGTEARQAFLGRPVFYVLAGGLILAALFLISTQIWNVSQETPAPGGIASEAVSGVLAPPAASGAVAPAVPAPPVNVAPPAPAPVDPALAPASAAPAPPANPAGN